MAMVELSTVWLNVASNLSECIALPAWVDTGRSETIGIDYRVTSSGRVRQVTTPAHSKTWSVSVDWCPPDVVAWLIAHRGILLCARDPAGGKMYGSYPTVDYPHIKAPCDPSSMSLTLTEITHSEAV